MCIFSVTQEIANSGSNGTWRNWSLGWQIAKEVYSFASKSIYFYVGFEFFMCAIPCFILKKYISWSKVIDFTFFLLKFKIKYMLLSINLQRHTLHKAKKAYYKTFIEMYRMVPEYKYMNYFFHKRQVENIKRLNHERTYKIFQLLCSCQVSIFKSF